MAIIKGTPVSGGEAVTIKTTEGGLFAPYSLLWTAKGYGFQAMATAAVAALVVRPSTLSIATLRNTSANKNLVIERAFAHNLVAAAVTTSVLWLCSHPPLSTAGTNEITVRNSTNGGTPGGSETTFENAATVADDGWFPWGQDAYVLTVTTPGGVLMAEIGGRIIVPPTASLSISVVSSVNTATFTCGFHWFEVPIGELTNS